MSDHQKENEQRIAAYLQNRLSPEEREAFKRSLSEDDELRLQYVDALMNRAGTEQLSAGTGGTVMEGESLGVTEAESGGSGDVGAAGTGSDMEARITLGNVEAANAAGDVE